MMSNTNENVDQVKYLVHKNRRIKICEAATMLGILFGSVLSILKGSEYTSHCKQIRAQHAEQGAEAKSCQHMPGLQQKLQRNPEFLLQIIAGDKNQNHFQRKMI